MPVTVGRERSVAAVNAALKTEDKMVLVVAQRDPAKENPGLEDLYTIGTKAIVKQVGRTEDAIAQLDSLAESLLEAGKKEDALAVINQILLMEPPNANQYRQLLMQLQSG